MPLLYHSLAVIYCDRYDCFCIIPLAWANWLLILVTKVYQSLMDGIGRVQQPTSFYFNSAESRGKSIGLDFFIMRKIKALIVTVIAHLCCIAASAHDFEVDGIYYNITSSTDLTVSVTCQGNSYYEYSYEYSGSVVIPEKVTYNSKEYSVTSIGQSAFKSCSGLTSVTIPNSVTSIGSYVFEGCSGLTSVTIPKSVTSIGSSAFYGCSGLKTIEVEYGNIKYDSRDNCNAIIETNTNGLITGCMNTVIPNSVTSIGDAAFSGCFGLTSVTIPNSVASIGISAFYCCI